MAPRRRAVTVLAALGLDPEAEHRYHQVLPLSGTPIAGVASALGVPEEHLGQTLAPLLAHRIVSVTEGRLRVRPLAEALAEALAREADATAATRERLDGLAAAVPLLVAAGSRPGPGEVEDVGAIDGEVSSGGNALALLTALIEQSKGDLLFLRPDTWMMPRESAMARVVGRAVASGRRSRAIYPVRAAREAPEALEARVAEGEEVRLLDDLPTRLMIIGTTHAIVPEPLGFADEPRILVRQGAIVGALTLLFELYWQRAVAAPELLDSPTGQRAFLLRQLASGAKDEQIARTLGVGLRTVRRRVAELMIELGVDTRFQAGAEAVRRGWL
ncbi:DNA-binding response regulator [Nocardioides cynanchi]|uniref:DNA-binding response regulator n=1 Tax=Nocardioides cynanchi TaxID=2558918 RepID=UPI00124666A9|nr:DNA-binding response regulator [Nocardioides cynanchi]